MNPDSIETSAVKSKRDIWMNVFQVARQVLAYALALQFFFGSLSVLNKLGASFVYYFPRAIRVVVFGAEIDLAVWIASILCVCAVMLGALPTNRFKRMVTLGLALLIGALGLTVFVTAGGSPSAWSVYSLFLFASVCIVVLLLYLQPNPYGQSSKSLIMLMLVYLLSFLTVIEISSAIHYSLQAFDVNTTVGTLDAAIELQLSYASYGLIPWMYVAFLFSWAWVPVVRKVFASTGSQFIIEQTPRLEGESRQSVGARIAKALEPKLFLVLALAVFIGYYPYFQNPPWVVGTDAYWRYFDPLVRMSGDGALGAFAGALTQQHPVPLMILYALHMLLQMPFLYVVRLAQLLLVTLLGFAAWWFLAYNKDYNFGLTVFLLSVLSITTTIGFYTSIIANWMALIVWVLFFAYVSLRGVSKLRLVDFVVLLTLSTALLFIHPWTWGVFAVGVTLASLVTLVRDGRSGVRNAGLVLAVIFLDVLLALTAISYLSTSQGWRVMDALRLYTFVIDNPSSIFWFWDALTWLTRVWAPFFSPLYLTASIVGVFTLASDHAGNWVRRLAFGWLVVSGIGSILIAPVGFNIADPSGSETQLWRLLYLTPLWAFAPFGVNWLSKLPRRGKTAKEQTNQPNSSDRTTQVWVCLLLSIGAGLAWTTGWERGLLLVFALPIFTGALLLRSRQNEPKFVSDLILAVFLLVAFNNAARGLSQLLRDPHIYRPRNQ